MKKILLFITVFFIGTISVFAAGETCAVNTGVTTEAIDIPSLGTVHMSNISLDGNIAFCLDAGDRANRGYSYASIDAADVPPAVYGILEWYYTHSNVYGIKEMAQAAIWAQMEGKQAKTDVQQVILEVLYYYLGWDEIKCEKLLSTYYNSLEASVVKVYNNQDYYKDKYTIFSTGIDGFQRLITNYSGDPDCPEIDPEDPEIPLTCITDPTITTTTCGSQSSFVDTTDWNCIVNDSDGTFVYESTNEYASSNNLCKVYCREEVYTDFPSNYISFNAGQYFQVGTTGTISLTWGPIGIYGYRECKTYYKNSSGTYVEGFNSTQATSLYETKLDAIKTAYDAYRLAKGYADGSVNYKSTSTNYAYADRVSAGYCKSGSTMTDGVCIGNSTGGTFDPVMKCPDGYSDSGSLSHTNACYKISNYTHTCSVSNAYITTAADKYLYVTNDNSTATSSDCNNTYSASTSAYDTAVNDLASLVAGINYCTSGSKIYYDLNPTVSVYYEGDSNYSSTTDVLTNSENDVTYGFLSGNGTAQTFTNYTCSLENGCAKDSSNTTYFSSYNNVTSNTVTIAASNSYYLTTGYQYIDKVTGNMFGNTSSLSQYIDLGITVIPLSPTRNPGNYLISLIYNDIGNDGYFDEFTGGSVNYICEYTIVNKLTGNECEGQNPPAECDPDDGDEEDSTGIDVIYRPIDLSDPFPGETGTGRETGSNWCYYNDCTNDNATVEDVILENRNVEGNDVYNLEPIYTITLTPAVIQEIRNYNDSVDNDYADFNLVCDAYGEECKSTFIHSTFAGYFGGTCSVSNANFNTCR